MFLKTLRAMTGEVKGELPHRLIVINWAELRRFAGYMCWRLSHWG